MMAKKIFDEIYEDFLDFFNPSKYPKAILLSKDASIELFKEIAHPPNGFGDYIIISYEKFLSTKFLGMKIYICTNIDQDFIIV